MGPCLTSNGAPSPPVQQTIDAPGLELGWFARRILDSHPEVIIEPYAPLQRRGVFGLVNDLGPAKDLAIGSVQGFGRRR